ncbi:MAG: hypothetical protein OXP08_06060, partial [bacterium]|nr:hypothetical protein [bacterium]
RRRRAPRARRTTPRGKRIPVGRRRLAKSVWSRIKTLPGGGVQLYVGWRYGRRTGIRPQQGMAVEFGHRRHGRHVPGRGVIHAALRHAAGPDGERFRQALIEAIDRRIQELVRKHHG